MHQLKKNIFICWFQGTSHLSKHPKASLFQENIKNWTLLNPDWNIILVSHTELRNACKTFSKKCLKLYDSFKAMHLKIDLGRYVLLYLYGGMYVDIDMYILRSLNTSNKFQQFIQKKIHHEHILGLSSLNLDLHESLLFIGKKHVINNAMMISTKNNPLLSLAIQHIISNSTHYTTTLNIYSKIQQTTGPIFINTFFPKFIQHNTYSYIEIFPHYFFEPASPYGSSNITEETIAIHTMELSWIPSHIKSSIYFYYTIKPFIIPTLITLLSIIISTKTLKIT